MARPASFTIIPPIDTYPVIVAFAQTIAGKVALLVVFSFGLSFSTESWPYTSAILTVMTFLPRYRAILLVVATFGTFMRNGWYDFPVMAGDGQGLPGGALFKPLIVAAVLVAFALYYHAVRQGKGGWLSQRPVRNLLVWYCAVIVLAAQLPPAGSAAIIVWAFAIVFGKYLWFFNYALLDRNAKDTAPLALQTGHFIPFWGGYNTPFPKGAAYLRKIEAGTPAQLAVCQLKGIKLIYWALVLLLLQRVLRQILYGHPGDSFLGISFSLAIPSLSDVVHGRPIDPYPWHINWLALVASFFYKLVAFSVWGHGIIAVCRMAGYNALRNTCNPLRSATIAEFWNRYYYYFKELLVDNFFYPAFLRYWKKKPRLRLFFATMAAAGFGNVLYHFLRDIHEIINRGPWDALVSFHVYMFYGVVLGAAIGLSQLFEKKKRQDMSWLKRNIINPFCVIAFYCVLSIFDAPDRNLTIVDNFSFLLRLL
jgi:hypothetical protein